MKVKRIIYFLPFQIAKIFMQNSLQYNQNLNSVGEYELDFWKFLDRNIDYLIISYMQNDRQVCFPIF